MPARRNKFKTSWAIGSSASEPLNDKCSVGRKLLEKMGWENGLGLGKDNQGMIENPLWKYHRGNSKRGFKCKDEMANEILPHQNAFEDLLGELNSQTGEESINIDDSIQRKARERIKSCKKRMRYQKMARAKDISNYSAKDFEGIVGKEVTKKNVDLLCEIANSNTPSNLKVTNKVFFSQVYESSSEQFVVDNNSFNVQKSNDQLCVSQKHVTTFVESNTISDGSYGNGELAEIRNPKKKNKQHSKSSFTVEPNALEYCSTQAVASTSAECIDNQSKESEDSEDVFNTEISVKKKSRKKIEGNYENYAAFTTIHCTLQSSEIKKKKKKKKMKENSEYSNTCYTDYSNFLCDTNCDEKPTYPEELICSTKSISEIDQKDTVEDEGVSKNAVTQFDTSVRTSNKFSNLERAETKKEGNKDVNNCTSSNDADKNGANNSLKFLLQTNNFFLTGEERKKIEKHLAENPEVLQQVASAFVGSNLMSIKGYGNW